MSNGSSTIERTGFRIGDNVRFRLVQRDVIGTIVEDRGPLGIGGRRLYRVRVVEEPENWVIELPEQDLHPLRVAPEPPTADHMAEYFKNGGLVAVLQRNMVGGKHQPRVWLKLDSRQNVTFTLEEAPGAIGGAVVPFSALREDRIFTPKRDNVILFLMGFGLSETQAKAVVATVGTRP